MAHKRFGNRGPGFLSIAEESVELLRHAPRHVLLSYFLGTVPFIIFSLYALGELSFNPTGASLLPALSAIGSVLFIWMKYHQSRFMAGLLAFRSGLDEPIQRGSIRFRSIVLHAFFQPLGLIALGAGFVLMFPFMRLSALFNYISIQLALPEPFTRVQFEKAVRVSAVDVTRHLALNWLFNPWFLGMACLLIMVVLPVLIHGFQVDEDLYYILAGLVVFVCALSSPLGAILYVNIALLLFMLPGLILTFSGIESAFSRLGINLLSTLFFVSVLMLTHLILDPVMKSIYVIMFFYDSSRTTGRDLLVQLQRIASRTVMILFVFSALQIGCPLAHAQESPEAENAGQSGYIDSLDEALRDEMSRPEYLWKLDRDYSFVPEDARNINALTRFLGYVSDFISKWYDKLKELVKKIRDWWHDLITPDAPNVGDSLRRSSEGISQSEIAAVMLALASLLFAILLVRLRRHVRNRPLHARAVESPVSVEVESDVDAIAAAALPESQWIETAERLLKEGDRSGAMRAFYYAVLACLASLNLLILARHKTDRDYQSELTRRSVDIPGLAEEFTAVMRTFQLFRYGNRELTNDGLDRFRQMQEALRYHASA